VFTKVVRPVPEAPKSAQVKDVEEPKRSVYKGALTDDHDRKLNTLFDLVASASSGERHCGTSWSSGGRGIDRSQAVETDSGSD
jgi:hypothetical protein